MSKNNRHIPYEVAYQRVTGRKNKEIVDNSVRSMTSILRDAREGDDEFTLANVDHPHRDNAFYNLSIGYNPDYHDVIGNRLRPMVQSRAVTNLGSWNVYPERHYHPVANSDPLASMDPGITYSPRSIDHARAVESVTDPNIGMLDRDSDLLLDHLDKVFPRRGYNKGDKTVLLSDVAGADLVPVDDGDGVIFAIVTEGYYRMSSYGTCEFLYHSPVIVRLYRAQPQVKVTVTRHDDADLTCAEYMEIHRLCRDGDDPYPVRIKKLTNEYRRSAERDMLRETVKMINAGNDPLEIDVDEIDYHDNYDNYW